MEITPRGKEWRVDITSLFFASILCVGLGGELRFCYKGPHRIRYQDCPGGFIAKKPFQATCSYYFMEKGTPYMKMLTSKDVCNHENYHVLDHEQETIDENNLQFFRFYDVKNNMNVTDAGEKKDICNETCLADYLESKYWDPVARLVDKPETKPEEVATLQKKYVELTKLIMIKLINEDDYEEDVLDKSVVSSTPKPGDKSPPATSDIKPKSNWTGKVDFLYELTDVSKSPLTSMLKMLSKSMRVMYKKCKPFLEPSFYTLVFRSMQELRRIAEFFPNVHIVPLKKIMANLQKCEVGDNKNFQLNGSSCDDKRVIKTITNLKKNLALPYAVSPRSFKWGSYDPIIEAAWSAIQFVHGHCFQYFEEDVLHFSLYVRAMNELFSQPLIRRHWTNPAAVGKGRTLWEMAYDTGDILNQMHNLDACVSAAYDGSIFKNRLERPFTSEEALADPKYETPNEAPAPGWTKGIADYWNMYENKGFQQMVDELGICVKDPATFTETGRGFIDSICEYVV